jgi:hypothetical protein
MMPRGVYEPMMREYAQEGYPLGISIIRHRRAVPDLGHNFASELVDILIQLATAKPGGAVQFASPGRLQYYCSECLFTQR